MQLNTAQKCVKGETKSRINRTLFNLESLTFAQTSMPTYSKATPDIMSPATFGRNLLKFEIHPKMPRPTAWVEFLQNGLSEANKILHTYRGQYAPQTCRIERH